MLKSILIVLGILAVLAFGIFVWPVPQMQEVPATATTATPSLAPTSTLIPPTVTLVPAASATLVGDFALLPNTLGEKPADANEDVYKLPYESGTITDQQGNGIYTQSGKDGSAKLNGVIPENAWLQIDSYILWKNGQKFTGGNLIVVAGPIDLAVANVEFKDGGANLVTGDLQAFLDDNVWGKFCRGNIATDGVSFTYKPWALKNIQLPEGITFKSLSNCPKSASEDTTTIPALP
ncbi:MAG: hypothetical protein Q8M92_02490 [Candidatus Subteraquimicrobiales bacterium]|nr:hypothetical protein [Candidatus Subteraquimicrobiales bacterium]